MRQIRHSYLLTMLYAALVGGCSSVQKGPRTISNLEHASAPEVRSISADEARSRAMNHYDAYLQSSPNSARTPEALKRLADLNLEKEQSDRAHADSIYSEESSKAAQLYEELLNRFPDQPNRDQLLYQLARAHDLTAAAEPSMKALDQYAREHAGSDKYDEVQFRRGEFLFIRKQYAEAEIAYRAVIQHSEASSFYAQALYKLGWSQFKQQQYKDSLDSFMQLLDRSTAKNLDASVSNDRLADTAIERLQDTLRVASLNFSYLSAGYSIREYFSETGARVYEPILYESLAALHISKERFTDAAQVYHEFSLAHLNHQDAPLFQSRVIDIYKQAGFSNKLIEEKRAYVERYEPASTYWHRREHARQGEIYSQVQRHLRDLARHYHAEAQNIATKASFRAAGKWYRLYLKSFINSDQAPYMNFLYAELLNKENDHARAAAEYARTAYEYGAHEKAAESGYAAVLSHEKRLLQGKSTADKQALLTLSTRSALQFANYFPAHVHARSVRTQAAERLFAMKDYSAAINAAMPLTVDAEAPSKLVTQSWIVIAHSLFEMGDFQQSEAAYQQLLGRSSDSAKLRASYEEKLAASIYKQAERSRNDGQMQQAAETFLRIFRQAPNSAINALARYDAASIYLGLRAWKTAIQILEPWRRDYPEHELGNSVHEKLAVLYRENQQYSLAAKEFEYLSKVQQDLKLQRESSWAAAQLYRQAKNDEQSIRAYKQYIKRFPQPMELSLEARQALIELYSKAGVTNKKKYWQRKIVALDRSAGKQRTNRSRFLAANAKLDLVEDQADAFRKVQLREPLKKSLANKKRLMKSAIKGYTDAASYKVSSVTTSATYSIAKIYTDFGEALLASERPHNLNAEEREQYDLLLEEQAYPFEEQAIAYHESNLQRIDAGVYDQWVQKSLAQLATLLPVRYAKNERSERFVTSK